MITNVAIATNRCYKKWRFFKTKSVMKWISIKKELPNNGEKVRYKMIKKIGLFKKEIIEDVGWFQNGEFLTIDPRAIYPITHWKYLN